MGCKHMLHWALVLAEIYILLADKPIIEQLMHVAYNSNYGTQLVPVFTFQSKNNKVP